MLLYYNKKTLSEYVNCTVVLQQQFRAFWTNDSLSNNNEN